MTHHKYSRIVLVASALALPLRAQGRMVGPVGIGQMADEVLGKLFPWKGARPSEAWKRGMFFDRQETLSRFHQDTSIPMSSLKIHAPVREGTRALLADCDELLRKDCASLGWAMYFAMEPLEITDTTARIRAAFAYADRLAPFVEGTAPVGKGRLSGSSAVVYLARTRGGPWKVVKTIKSDIH